MKKLFIILLLFFACTGNTMYYKSYKIEIATQVVTYSSQLSYATVTIYDSSGNNVHFITKVVNDYIPEDRREDIQELLNSAISWIDSK